MIVVEIILAVLLIICAVFAVLYVSFIAMTPTGMTFKEANKMFVKYTKMFFGIQ
ncbi:MAG: hypothetical protein J6J23_02910 [Clostridia bacterium]|nr:hypothetical protein [Clostridia bacterium]